MAKHYHYTPQGTCSRDIEITIDDDGPRGKRHIPPAVATAIAKGIGSLVRGMTPRGGDRTAQRDQARREIQIVSRSARLRSSAE